MTKTKKLRVLQEIYNAIPSPACKGLCADQCTTAPVSPFELEHIEQAAGRELPTMPTGDAIGGLLLGSEIGQPCPLLVLGRCGTYEHRPLICRAYGAAEGLPCPHGCRPAALVPRPVLYNYFKRVAAL